MKIGSKKLIILFCLLLTQIPSKTGAMANMSTEFTQYKRYKDELDKRLKQADTWINQNLTLQAQLQRLATFKDSQIKALYNKDPDRFKRMGRTVDNLSTNIKALASIESLMTKEIEHYSSSSLSKMLSTQYKSSIALTNQKLDKVMQDNGIIASVKSTGDRVSAIMQSLGQVESPTQTVQLTVQALQGLNDTVTQMETAYVESGTTDMLVRAEMKAKEELDKKKLEEQNKKMSRDFENSRRMSKSKQPVGYQRVYENYSKNKK